MKNLIYYCCTVPIAGIFLSASLGSISEVQSSSDMKLEKPSYAAPKAPVLKRPNKPIPMIPEKKGSLAPGLLDQIKKGVPLTPPGKVTKDLKKGTKDFKDLITNRREAVEGSDDSDDEYWDIKEGAGEGVEAGKGAGADAGEGLEAGLGAEAGAKAIDEYALPEVPSDEKGVPVPPALPPVAKDTEVKKDLPGMKGLLGDIRKGTTLKKADDMKKPSEETKEKKGAAFNLELLERKQKELEEMQQSEESDSDSDWDDEY